MTETCNLLSSSIDDYRYRISLIPIVLRVGRELSLVGKVIRIKIVEE